MKVDALAVLRNVVVNYNVRADDPLNATSSLREFAPKVEAAVAAVEEIVEALYMALPYVTDAEMYPEQFKPGTVQRHVKQIRAALAKVQP